MAELAEHGVTLPPNMQGLTDEQLVDLKLKDEWEDKCVPSGGAVFKKDDIGRRNGHGELTVFFGDQTVFWTGLCDGRRPCVFFASAPNEKMKGVLLKTVDEAKALISKVSPHMNCNWRPTPDVDATACARSPLGRNKRRSTCA